ncbi:hypothetical protein JF50_25865 [Pseudoalteromonas luteoviolacea]|uniref:Uncharacterized protein n=1 Tax=Pseudoalteromonas luteoviolacea TaxID=43657 RepID=A0A0C1ML85_9GAMM|nr:hypothetical protein JF50_25865 [Pseudoalteromonas luteoviolacea]
MKAVKVAPLTLRLSCKRIETTNAVSTFFLRKVINVQNVTIMSEASTFNLRKVSIVRKVYDTARSAAILFAQGEISRFN